MGLITRFYGPNAKGSKLTIKEMDDNLYYLQSFGVTGVTYSSNTLTIINPTGGTITATIDTDKIYLSGGTYNSLTESIDFSGNNPVADFSVNVSQLLDDTNTYTTGATLIGSVVEFNRNDLNNAYSVDLSSLEFTGVTTDGITITGDGTPGNPLIGAGGAVNYSNVLFVDIVNGDNGTATQNDFTKPYSSVAVALNASDTITKSSEDRVLIYVRRGLYGNSPSGDAILELRNNVDIHCETGVVFQSTSITDNGFSVESRWTGKANFTGSILFTNELLRLTGASTKVFFEFDNLYTNRAAFGIFGGTSATISGRKVFVETFNTGYGMTTRTTGNVSINITEEFAAWHDPISFSSFAGKFYMTCPRIYLHEGDTYGGNFKHVVIARNNLGGEAVINGDLIVNNVAGYYGGNSGALAQWTDGFMTIRLNGNIYSENQFGIYGLGSSGAARLIINGDVKTNHLVGYIASNCNVVFRNGTLMNWNNLSGVSEGYPVMSVAGSSKVWIENCHLYSLGLGATYPNIAGIWKDTTTAQLSVNNSVHSGADAPGFFIRNSAGGQPVNNVRIMNCRSTKPLDTNITDLLSPSGFIQDLNILSINFI